MTARVKNESTGMALADRFNNRSSAAGIRSPGASIVLAATATMAMGFGGLGLITVFMNPMEADFSWSRSDTSLGYALSTAGMAIGGLFWGRLSDRMDLRILLAIGATGMVASLLAMSLLQSLLIFYIAHVVYGGFGFSVLYSPLLPEATRLGDGARHCWRSTRARLAPVLRQHSDQCIWLAMGFCGSWRHSFRRTCTRLAGTEMARGDKGTTAAFSWRCGGVQGSER